MVAPPVLTSTLIERLESTIARKGREALLRAAKLPGNPYEVTVAQHGELFAHRVATLPHLPWYNSVVGLNDLTCPALDDVLSLYTSSGITPSVSVWATRLTPTVGAALFDRGFTPCGVGATLYATATAPRTVTVPGVMVRELAAGEEMETFNEVLLSGYAFTHPAQRALAVLEHNAPDVRRYLAVVEGEPAAVATLYVHDETAFLTGATTLPAMRGRGAQMALIRARLADVAGVCEFATVTTAFTSRSQQNLEKNGFRVAQIKTTWTPRGSLVGPGKG
ncbi:hypothetical protein [Deinococcus yavapaiensis]|uniref:N-acetyltransferase domain-containing protein n=1 Tax=Deinococcus yavapaiensis KR-236 TaxID=694435 RepID=A0A318S0T8_9DEIO|nr:hypothetical protein [Deinococcus yavapaiensis]PYE50506.1 hypothetical protein DES52_11724 [Deinococcus yavapaiensis KR-236]